MIEIVAIQIIAGTIIVASVGIAAALAWRGRHRREIGGRGCRGSRNGRPVSPSRGVLRPSAPVEACAAPGTSSRPFGLTREPKYQTLQDVTGVSACIGTPPSVIMAGVSF